MGPKPEAESDIDSMLHHGNRPMRNPSPCEDLSGGCIEPRSLEKDLCCLPAKDWMKSGQDAEKG
jgi:hypothetical protein